MKSSSIGKYFSLSNKSYWSNSGNFIFYKVHQYYLDALIDKGDKCKYYVCIEPLELTFMKYTADSQLSEVLLMIPFNYSDHSVAEISTSVKNYLRSAKNSSLIEYFLIDLFISDYFKESGRAAEIRQLILGIPILQGYTFKLIFNVLYAQVSKNKSTYIIREEKLKPSINRLTKRTGHTISQVTKYFYLLIGQDQFHKELKTLYAFDNNPILQKLIHFYDNWLNFIYTKGNEHYFSSNIFRSTDLEILDARKKFNSLELRGTENNRTNSFLADIKEKQNKQSNRYFIGRYGLVEGLSLRPWLAFLAAITVIFTVVLIFTNTILFQFGENDLQGGLLTLSDILFSLQPYVLFSLFFLFPILFGFISKSFPGIILPRLVVAIFSGWLIFLTAEDIMKIDYAIEGTPLFFVSFGMIAFLGVFLLNEIKNAAPSLEPILIFFRITQIAAISLIISYTVGFFLMSFVNTKFLSLDSFLVANSGMERGARLELTKYELLKELKETIDNLRSIEETSQNKLEKDIINGTFLKDKTRLDLFNLGLYSGNKITGKALTNEIDSFRNFIATRQSLTDTLSLKLRNAINTFHLSFEQNDFSSFGENTPNFTKTNLNDYLKNYLGIEAWDNIKAKDSYKLKYLRNNDPERILYNASVLYRKQEEVRSKVESNIEELNHRSLYSELDVMTQKYNDELVFASNIIKDPNSPRLFKYKEIIDSAFIQVDKVLSDHIDFVSSDLSNKIYNGHKLKQSLAEVRLPESEKINQKLNTLRQSFRSRVKEDQFVNSANSTVLVNSKTVTYKKKLSIFGIDFSIYPNMTLFRSLIALFVGIFLQLIIQDKTITEPL